MPQLNPGPWFFIFVVSWMVLIAMSIVKTSKYHLPNPSTQKHYKNLNTSWTWPWP